MSDPNQPDPRQRREPDLASVLNDPDLAAILGESAPGTQGTDTQILHTAGANSGEAGQPRAVPPAGHTATRTAIAFTALMTLMTVAGAAADPTGLIAPVGWTGAGLNIHLWSLAPFIVFGPLMLVLCFGYSRAILLGALSATPRRWVFFRLWLIAVTAALLAKFAYGLAITLPALLTDGVGLKLKQTVIFLVWSTGYTGVKMLVLGLLPALIGALFWSPRAARRNGQLDSFPGAASTSTFPAGMAVLGLAALIPWLSRNWWDASPVGYAHTAGWRLFAPVGQSGSIAAIAATAVFGLSVWLHIHSGMRRQHPPRSKGALFVLGATAAVAGGLALAWVQTAIHIAAGTDVPGGSDAWWLAATYLRLAEGAALGALVAVPIGLLTILGDRLPGGARTAIHAGVGARTQWWALIPGIAAIAGAYFVASTMLAGFQAPAPHIGRDPKPATLPAVISPPVEPGTAPPPALPALTVRYDDEGPVIADQRGAQVTLRGVNVNQLNDYAPVKPGVATTIPLTAADFADIAAFGLNTVRLTLSWSKLEPQPGVYAVEYIKEIRRAVDGARRNGLYVVLDLHQDAWGPTVGAAAGTTCRPGGSPMIGWDGAPGWATLTDGAPPCQVTGRDVAANVSRAFQSFYFNRDDLQDRLAASWAVLAREFAAEPAIAGYDLLNEPGFAENPPLSSSLRLGQFHARTIEAIREAEKDAPAGFPHLVFLEPSILWSGFGADTLPPRAFTSDSLVVFSPHLYNESITFDRTLGLTLVSIERGFALASRAAAQLGAPLWIGEWGFFGQSTAQQGLISRQTAAEDAARVGSAAWVWKQACGDPHNAGALLDGSLQVSGNIRRVECPGDKELVSDPVATAHLRRPYVRAAPGRIEKVKVLGDRIEVSGTRKGIGRLSHTLTPDQCSLDIWVQGVLEPSVSASSGVTGLRAIRVNPGGPTLGPSGGWRITGCASQDFYTVVVG